MTIADEKMVTVTVINPSCRRSQILLSPDLPPSLRFGAP
jgi:hypothetical protein